MKPAQSIAAVLLCAALAACGNSSTPQGEAAGAGPAFTLPLNHAGRWITDAQGKVVILHGLNMVYKLPPYAPDAVGFGDDDAAFLAAEGYDTVRLGIIYKGLEPGIGVYDETYLSRIAATADLLGRHGIVSLLDFHQDLYNEKFGGEGLPDWAVEDDGLPNQPQLNFTLDYFLEPGLNAAFGNFWNNAAAPDGVGLQDRYAAAWQHVAAHFRDDHNVLGYDLFNEPWPGLQAATCLTPLGCPLFDASLSSFVQRNVAAIRQADPLTLIWYEPNVIFNNGAATYVGNAGDAHAGFSFHDYCLTEPFVSSNTGCDTFDNLVFANALSHVASTGDALLMTEFGASNDTSNLEAMVDRADASMVGWQEWAYCYCGDPTTSGSGNAEAIVIDPSKAPVGDNLVPGTLQVLSRPYPQAIAGTPKSYGFDSGSGTFSLDYGTARADGTGVFPDGAETVVVLPARQYPQGHAVTVHGATIASSPGDLMLRLQSCPGVSEITVSVSRTGTTQQSCS
ncbi:MAG TPA: cellulase family glycosylhydrolase [Nevskia sp.]|nr:cellulase family glycosylhydrolase [Nevskia sp.]